VSTSIIEIVVRAVKINKTTNSKPAKKEDETAGFFPKKTTTTNMYTPEQQENISG